MSRISVNDSDTKLLKRTRGASVSVHTTVSEELDTEFRRRKSAPLWKRMLDISLIALSLPITAPLMGTIAIVIKLVSKGPILFRQERIGLFGGKFECFKFRTMRTGAETLTHEKHFKNLMDSDKPMVKIDAKGDNRIIPMGRLLRVTGLDELPQLLNVLFGDMSIVGPRPCIQYEYEKYLPWQRERFNTLPGLTGLWQVSGKNRTTFTEMMKFDIQYVRQKSLWMDLGIIARTIPAILQQVADSRRKATTDTGLIKRRAAAAVTTGSDAPASSLSSKAL